MCRKGYYDMNGNLLCSDEVIFTEDEDVGEFFVSDWTINQEEYYHNILKENTYIYNQLIKEYN